MKATQRPIYHFTPPQNFMNDPNGLVYYQGDYHLFYQHNPFGELWGHMSWGHAVSRDLVSWQHLPVALYEENDVMIFSGSAVVDWLNTSDLGMNGEPPLIAIYTGHSPEKQTQNLAFSTDRGLTWTKYARNPLVDIGSTEFRDPKVFWHAPTRQWVMATVLADQHKVRFDGSPDLRHWTHLSNFGPAGAANGLWECPDLFALSVEGQPEERRWVLKVDEQFGIGAQYFIGDFDGKQFTNAASETTILRVDHGMDFYAAQSWSDAPDGRRVWLGWLNNWAYALFTPTAPWRGQFTIPRQLILREDPEGLRLIQQPVEELEQLRCSLYHATGAEIATVNEQLASVKMGIAMEIQAEFELDGGAGFEIRIGAARDDGEPGETLICYDAETQELFVDRSHSGYSGFAPGFAAVHRAALASESGRLALQIFLDACSLEVFGGHGRVVMSELIFPEAQETSLRFSVRGERGRLAALDIWELKGQ